MTKKDPIQERISSYENRFNLLVQEIETDEILSKIEGNHLAGVLIQMKNKFIKKKIKGITVDIRSKNCLYVTIGKWVVYIDNSTSEQIINSWKSE